MGALGAVCSGCSLSQAVMNSLGSGTMNALSIVALNLTSSICAAIVVFKESVYCCNTKKKKDC